MRNSRTQLGLPGLLLGLMAFLGATAEPVRAQGKSPPAKKAAPKPAVSRDYYFINEELIRNKDGTLTWFYRTNHVGATNLADSLKKLKLAGLKAEINNRYEWNFRYDRTAGRIDLTTAPTKTPKPNDNVCILTFPAAYKDILEEFIERFDVPDPQVHIAAKVVEVTLDNDLEFGVSMFFDRGGGDPSTGEIGTNNPSPFFRAFRTQNRPTSFDSSVLSPDNSGLTMVFDDLLEDFTFAAAIEALEAKGAAEILSSPNIVASQGQLATLVTGQDIPILEVRTTGTTDTVTTKFEEVGIRLDFMPLHIGREYVKLRVRTEVSSVTGFVEVTGIATSTANPIISRRNAESVITIRDGMTLAIGGLYALSEIDDKSGVPLLQDIPVLGFLFSRTRKQKVKSELDFFVTPTILHNRLAKSIFVPPMERKRLKDMKDKEDRKSGRRDREAEEAAKVDREKDVEKDG
jgi:type II secretory pathway component GspD/PulD (secretin)